MFALTLFVIFSLHVVSSTCRMECFFDFIAELFNKLLCESNNGAVRFIADLCERLVGRSRESISIRCAKQSMKGAYFKASLVGFHHWRVQHRCTFVNVFCLCYCGTQHTGKKKRTVHDDFT